MTRRNETLARIALSCAIIRQACALLPTSAWTTVPLFCHVRWFNASTADIAGLSRFRSVTLQVEPDAPLFCEDQAEDVRRKLQTVAPEVPVFFYANLYFAEPNCRYFNVVGLHPEVWLNDSSGVPVKPGGRWTFDLSAPTAPTFWASIISNASAVDGSFGDSGCPNGAPTWFNASRAEAYEQGKVAAEAGAQNLAGPDRLFIANCPFDPHIGDGYIFGTRAFMDESFCSDFQPGGKPRCDSLCLSRAWSSSFRILCVCSTEFCRDELIYQVALAAWNNVTSQVPSCTSVYCANDACFVTL